MLINEERWWKGPNWLLLPKEDWSSLKTTPSLSDEVLSEMKASEKRNINEVLTAFSATATTIDVTKAIPCENFSCVNRLIQVTALVRRFILLKKSKCERKTLKALTTEEIKEANVLWLKSIQRQLFADHRYTQWQEKLGLFIDEDGLIRCRGRIEHADVSYSSRNPLLLPNSHPFTDLLILECHRRVAHNGVKETLSELRSCFWVIRGRQVVRRILFRCSKCRRFEGNPYSAAPPASLLEFRVKDDPAFTSVGVDFAGPFYIYGLSTRQNQASKVYLALYTCASSRAVHLDITPDLSADAFLRSFRRFISRRGIPKRVRSDNAKNFKSASKKLSRLLDIPEVQQFLAEKRVLWSFQLPRAPWWGGFFEKMIKCAKKCLKKMLGVARVTYDELYTLIVEVEAILNSRALTYVYPDGVEEPLTPSHLMTGRRLMSIPDDKDALEDDEKDDHGVLTRRERYPATLLGHFWKRWRKEYLLELREHHNMSVRSNNLPQISPDDIVTVMDDEGKLPRSQWKLGKIVKLIKGNDGAIRGAKL